MKLSLNQFTAPELEFDVFVELAVATGFRRVSPWNLRLESYGVDRGMELLARHGLSICCANAAGGFDLEAPGSWDETTQSSLHNVALAARMGAEALLTTTGPAPGLGYAEAERRFRDALAPVLEAAEASGVHLALEPLNSCRIHLTYLHRAEDALDLVDSIDSPNLGVCLDLNAAWRERGLLGIIEQRLDRVFLVQLSDQRIEDPAPPARVALGDGVMPLPEILDAFDAAGYAGPFDIELIGAAEPRAAIERSLAFLRDRRAVS